MSEPQITTKTIGTEIGQYTAITVKDKDSEKSFVINFKNNSKIGDEKETAWTIKDGKLYGKDGVIEDKIMEVTRYQAALIKAADTTGDTFIDDEDLNNKKYLAKAKEELKNSQSDFETDIQDPDLTDDGTNQYNGIISANVKNKAGIKDTFKIDIQTQGEIDTEAKEEAQYQEFLSRQKDQPSLFKIILKRILR